ncbi:MAG: hypothetical protein A2046_14210 [Bacteroidetes bacterium GWA2_30_7]|nr:MAG: hypothetical protein A2046_14210 [Bacteroidetes bacterium GWA2_30_7]
MDELVIKVKNVSKKYKIGKNVSGSLRETLVNWWGLSKSKTKSDLEEFWALKDISFEVKQGEVLGIIGKNGAGKSTLLKILSRITEPSTGIITIIGRVSSLLEVGTGFHPELTGRENIFLNGTILGMTRKEVKSKFEEIVDFSGVEKFIDTPIKHYSSGMQLRLAFSVAAFLEPEILIIDEVLTVGDAEFQKKCMGKMNDVRKSGRTILFVSHSMTAIQSLCSKIIFLENGKTSELLSVQEGVSRYLKGNLKINSGFEKFEDTKTIEKPAHIIEAKLLNAKYTISNQLLTCEDFYVELKWQNNDGIKITPSIELINYDGIKLFWSGDTIVDWDGSKKQEKGVFISTVKIPANFLKAGEYSFILGLYTQSPYSYHHLVMNTLHCSVIDPMDKRCIARGEMATQFENFIFLPSLEWKNEKQ